MNLVKLNELSKTKWLPNVTNDDREKIQKEIESIHWKLTPTEKRIVYGLLKNNVRIQFD